ncbi:type II toxin-antitoxin system HicA family toxin [Pseudomonas sp. MF6772]|uniref:type II toxin-antitoxin system HicA family toxin n=1 Tax=Pseudomonas sp. MF6772 TaxID=2797533 RepID=UPI0018E8C31C|nr:type II toxin-antitoxin system HicA family toxin [Pseudomonas sp. MF6772]MBJ2270737.1 type II toxin-antitoxin system HicA family toxin [Pseudomonas sp. MF6772]
MKYSEFRRWLEARGVTFTKSRSGSSHFKIKAPNGRQTIFPSHGTKEIGEGLRKEIIKQLGLKD